MNGEAAPNPLDFFPEAEREALVVAIERAFREGEAEVEARLLTTGPVPFQFRRERVQLDRERYLCGVGLDIGHFKAVKDSYGHDVGDTILRGISGIFASRLLEADLLAR